MIRLHPIVATFFVFSLFGCASTITSNTARTATEQLLVSNAIDQSLDKVSFAPFNGKKVFIEEKYLDCVDKNYVLASVRHRAVREGATLSSKPEESEIILEVRSGVVGTDTSDSFLGVPEITLPGMLTLPEVKLVSKSNQSGTAKIGLVAYDAKSGAPLGDGGISLAGSSNNNWYVLGIGPYQNGTIKTEIADSGQYTANMSQQKIPTQVAFNTNSINPAEKPARIRLTSESKSEKALRFNTPNTETNNYFQ